MINGRVSPDGALFALDETAPPGTTCMGGQALTPAGVAYVANNVLAEPPYFTPNGFKTDANGTLLVGAPPIVGYKGGLPYNAEQELVVQLNQPPVAGDSYVGGIRVGPAGGVYIIDVVPPTLGGFSDGFSNGFEVYDGPPIHTFSPADLFLNGEQGAWYDPSDLTTMFQDIYGTTPVTADGQTVGLILDKSDGLVLGPEWVTNGDFSAGSTGWTLTDASVVSGALDCSGPAWTLFANQPVTAYSHVCMEVKITVSNYVSGGIQVGFSPNITSNGTFTYRGYRSGYYTQIGAQASGSGFVGTIDDISVKFVSGNHAPAPSDAARPLKASTGLSDRINYDAVDDVLNTTFVSSLGTDCTVARANVGAGPTILTAQTIDTSYSDSTDNAGLVIVNRALTGPETIELTAWLTAKGATA